MASRDVIAWRAFYRRGLDLYGLTPADYRLLYVAQKGRCWICQTAKGIHPDDPKARGGRRLGVDHDHRTGVVRGLLCSGGDKTCNRTIGWHSPAALRRAADYLESRSKQPARVFREISMQRVDAGISGIPLEQEEEDRLAVAFLWPDLP
jgi:hypothetical protein